MKVKQKVWHAFKSVKKELKKVFKKLKKTFKKIKKVIDPKGTITRWAKDRFNCVTSNITNLIDSFVKGAGKVLYIYLIFILLYYTIFKFFKQIGIPDVGCWFAFLPGVIAAGRAVSIGKVIDSLKAIFKK